MHWVGGGGNLGLALTSQMSLRCLIYTRSVFMISWMTLVRICCWLSGCLWRALLVSSSCSSPWELLRFSGSSSWFTRSCRPHTGGRWLRGEAAVAGQSQRLPCPRSPNFPELSDHSALVKCPRAEAMPRGLLPSIRIIKISTPTSLISYVWY